MIHDPIDKHTQIMVVDDERIMPELIRFALELYGYTIITAANGIDALRAFKENPDIDAVITDYNMPGMNGIELIHEVLFLKPNVKCMLMTACLDHWEVQEFARTGLLDGLLEKPFNVESLHLIVEQLLNHEKEGAALYPARNTSTAVYTYG